MVATPQPDDLTAQIKWIKNQLDRLTRTSYVQYQPVPLLAAAANNDYTNATTTPKLLALGGYTFSAATPVVHFGYYVTFSTSGAATASIQLNATDAASLSTTGLLTTTGATTGASILTQPGTVTANGFVDTAYTVPAAYYGHLVMFSIYAQMVSGTGTVGVYPIYAREAAT